MAGKKRNENRFEKGKKLAGDFIEDMNKGEIISGAQRVINSAVSVLEEEIAAGILAAKKIEKKIIDVDDIRSDPNDLMNRIRRDTHEAVDLFLDAFAAISKQLNSLADNGEGKSKKEPKSKASSSKSKKNNKIRIEVDHPLIPGESTTLHFTLFENSENSTKIVFQKTNIIGQENQIINSRAIKLSPSKITLKLNEEKEITMYLKIPKNALPGKYQAFIRDSNSNKINVILEFEIIKS